MKRNKSNECQRAMQARRLVREQGEQMQSKDTLEKCDIKMGVRAGGQKETGTV